MFEPKTYVEKRLALVEALMNQLIGMRTKEVVQGSDEADMLQKMISNWQYHGHNIKVEEAKRVLGAPFAVTENTATRPWIANILRHNFGLLEVFGDGEYNPAPELFGNNDLKFTQWLAGLEDPNQVVRDTRPSEFFKDSMHVMAGLPVLKILTTDDQGRNFLHLIILFSGITVQSLALDHLPARWDWDAVPDGWRAETFSYLDNMSKRNFLLELARAIQLSRAEAWGDEPAVLYVPEDDGLAIDLAKEVTATLGMTYKAIKTETAVVPDEPTFEGLAEGFENAVAANEDELEPRTIEIKAHVQYAAPEEGKYRVFIPAGCSVDVLMLTKGLKSAGHKLIAAAVAQTQYGAKPSGTNETYTLVQGGPGSEGVFKFENPDKTATVTVVTGGVVSLKTSEADLSQDIVGVYVDIQIVNVAEEAENELQVVNNESRLVDTNEA